MAPGFTTIHNLLPEFEYSRHDNPTTIAALGLLKPLQDWLTSGEDVSEVAIPSVHVSYGFLSLSIGDVCVWDTENNDEAELNLGSIQLLYKSHLDDLMSPFWRKLDIDADLAAYRQDQKDAASLKLITYRYLDKEGKPLLRCPHCEGDFTVSSRIVLQLTANGDMHGQARTNLTSDGYLIDTDDNLVAKGFHSRTECLCGEELIDYEHRIEATTKEANNADQQRMGGPGSSG